MSTTPQYRVNSSSPSSDIKGILHHNKILFALLGSTIGLLALFFGIVFYLYYANCREKRSKEKKTNRIIKRQSDHTEDNDIEADGIINMEVYPCLKNGYTFSNNASVPTVKNEELSAKQLMFVARRIAPKEGYRDLALELNMEEHDISIIEYENPRCCKNASYKILKKWTELFPDKAVVTELLKTLGKVGRHDVVQDFYREYNEILIH